MQQNNTEEQTPKSSLINIRICLTSPMLGDTPDGSGNKNLKTDKMGGIMWFLPANAQWRFLLGHALRMMGKDGDSLDYISLPNRIKSPEIKLYTLSRTRRGSDDRTIFQCYQKGAVLTFNVALLSALEQDTGQGYTPEPLSVEDVKTAFRIVGETLGISPWGNKYGYGRFLLES